MGWSTGFDTSNYNAAWQDHGKCRQEIDTYNFRPNMASGRIAEVLDGSESRLTSSLNINNNDDRVDQLDSGSALQQFLDRIPISSIPGIKDALVLELKAGDSVRDAIDMLYGKDMLGAVIVDALDPDTAASMRFSDRFIGFIDFASMVLWSLEEYDKIKKNSMHRDIENDGFFSILDQIPEIGQTKVGALAKSFIWEPFFPVFLDDTILHALLLLSKHRLHVLPVIRQQKSDPGFIGFVTQNAIVQFLLQSSGLEWFDSIADKNLSDLRFEDREHPSCVYGDQTLADALKMLWKNHTCAVAVVDQRTKKLMGNVRNSDVHHLVKSAELLRNRTILPVEEFIHTETVKTDTYPTIEHDRGASLAARSLRLSNSLIPRMDSPVTSKENATLKQIMEHMIRTNSSFTFLVDDTEQVTGLVTLRDIILQFAPPCVNSSIGGGGFFELALEQSGCCVKNGSIIRNH